jgi:tRNA 2-selenouridine synthase
MDEMAQPTQEMFENLLAESLGDIRRSLAASAMANGQPSTINDIFIEDESQRIGNLKIPDSFWRQIRGSNILFLDIPFEERLNYLTEGYGKKDKEKLVEAILRIQKRLGGLEAKNGINFLQEGNYKECFRILLKYYDKAYEKGLYNRDNPVELINKISAEKVNAQANTGLLLKDGDMVAGLTEPE